jgi:hypothetical protein
VSRFSEFLFALGAHSPWIVGPVAVVGMLFLFPPGPVSSPEQGASIERVWKLFGIALAVSGLGFFATLVAGLVHCLKDASLTGGLKAFWALGMLFLGAILVPAYFWARVLPSNAPDGGPR